MKKLWYVCLAAALVVTSGLSALITRQTEALILYSQGDFVSPSVFRQFTRETGIQVRSYVSGQEGTPEGITGCDVILADTDELARLIQAGELAPLSETAAACAGEMDGHFLGLSYDPANGYTVPCLWSVMGLLYNPDHSERRVTGWSDLFDGGYQGKVLMPDQQRDAYAIALAALGKNVNSAAPEDLEAAYAYLRDQQAVIGGYTSRSGLEALLQTETAVLVPCYAGTAIEIMADQPELGFVLPSEGTWCTLLSYGVSALSRHQAAANQLIAFLCRPENLAACGTYSGYSTPCEAAYALLDPAWQANPLAYPEGRETVQAPVLLRWDDSLAALCSQNWMRLQYEWDTRWEQN